MDRHPVCRYVAHPPSPTSISRREVKARWPYGSRPARADGATHIQMEPRDLIESVAVAPQRARRFDVGAPQMQVALGKGNLDPGFLELAVGGDRQVAEHSHPAEMALGEGPQLEVERALSMRQKEGGGLGIGQHLIVLAGRLQQQLEHLFRIGSIANAHRHDETSCVVGERPVDHTRRDELGIGNDHVGSVHRHHLPRIAIRSA
jgi:hypothetical protein